jgi:hypothetical protein
MNKVTTGVGGLVSALALTGAPWYVWLIGALVGLLAHGGSLFVRWTLGNRAIEKVEPHQVSAVVALVLKSNDHGASDVRKLAPAHERAPYT